MNVYIPYDTCGNSGNSPNGTLFMPYILAWETITKQIEIQDFWTKNTNSSNVYAKNILRLSACRTQLSFPI